MKRREFLSKLEQKLNVLNDTEREKILNNYEKIINKRVKAGEDEKEVIKSFGNINTLVKKILKEYNINIDHKQEDLSDTFSNFITNLVSYLNNFFKSVFNGSSEDMLNFLLKLLVIFIIIVVLKIPFSIIKEFGIALLRFLPLIVNNIFIFTWRIFIDFSYIVTSIIVIFTSIKSDFKYFNSNINEKEVDRVINDFNITFKRIVTVIYNVFIVLFSIPLLGLFMLSTIFLGILITVLGSGVLMFGTTIFVFGIVILLITLISMIYGSIKTGGVK